MCFLRGMHISFVHWHLNSVKLVFYVLNCSVFRFMRNLTKKKKLLTNSNHKFFTDQMMDKTSRAHVKIDWIDAYLQIFFFAFCILFIFCYEWFRLLLFMLSSTFVFLFNISIIFNYNTYHYFVSIFIFSFRIVWFEKYNFHFGHWLWN